MQWLKDNMLWILTVWSGVNVILSPVATQVPATGFWGRALHFVVAVSPLDVIKAFKAVGTAATPPVGGP